MRDEEIFVVETWLVESPRLQAKVWQNSATPPPSTDVGVCVKNLRHLYALPLILLLAHAYVWRQTNVAD